MKNIYTLFFLVPLSAFAQGNYLKTTVYKDSTKTSIVVPTPRQAFQKATYFDGLGRPVQEVSAAQSSIGKSIVTYMEYDKMGKQPFEYLPYASDSEGGLAFQQYAKTEAATFYRRPENGNTSYAYSFKSDDGSALDRLTDAYSPGDSWVGSSNRRVSIQYLTNADGEIKHFKAMAQPLVNGYYPVALSALGNYPTSQLHVTLTSDENRNETAEYKDGSGRIVLKRLHAASGNHDTYYVYDQYGNLSYVLPPLSDGSGSQQDLDGLCYQYRYDRRNRLVEKKLPGKQWEFILYDKLDRAVATGPAPSPFSNIASPGGWLITKYDAFSRPIVTGWSSINATSSTRNTLQNGLNNQIESARVSESRSSSASTTNGVSFQYTNGAWPTTFHVLTINYYDNYDFPDAPATIPSGVLPDGTQPVYYNRTVKPIGLSTGNWIRILETSTAINAEKSYVLYDRKARAVRSYLKNYLGGYTQTDSRIDFSGKVIYTVTEHKRLNDDMPITIREDFTYTDQDRLLTHTHKINNGPAQLLGKNEYDALGQLKRKSVGRSADSPLQQVDYKYNVRGWLKGINNTDNLANSNDPVDLFAFKINYNDPETAQPLYNGNISETLWRTSSDNILRRYAYGYDQLNRLTEAVYQKPGAVPVPNSYGESASYDKNGNIKYMDRYGEFDDGVIALKIDQLAYGYQPNSNRLAKVTDATNNPNGFRDDSDGTNDDADDYAYDAYGNMLSDANKGISLMAYNHLHLPVKIIMVAGNIEYLYDAAGRRLRKTVSENAKPVKTQDYLSGLVYGNGVLEVVPTSEGYVKNTVVAGVNSFNYVYNYTDHLGNVRLSYGQDPATLAVKVLEESNYYPFGLKHKNYNMSEKVYKKTGGGVSLDEVCATCPVPYKYNYKYNGKEFQDEMGLNFYDYGARNYDPAIGRWMNIDPLAEQYRRWSPYNYCVDNPMRFVDPDGMGVNDVIIRGDLAVRATEKLNSASSLKITRDSNTGKLSATGEAKTDSDKLLLRAINSDKITVNLEATSKNTTSEGYIFGGQFGGSTKNKDGTVTATQVVNPDQADVIENFANTPDGSIVKHEVLEAFIGAEKSPGAPAGESGKYKKAHDATNKVYPEGNVDGKVSPQVDVSEYNSTTKTGTVNYKVADPNSDRRPHDLFTEKNQPINQQ